MARTFLFEGDFEIGAGIRHLTVYKITDDLEDIQYDCTIDQEETYIIGKGWFGEWCDIDAGITNMSDVLGVIIEKTST